MTLDEDIMQIVPLHEHFTVISDIWDGREASPGGSFFKGAELNHDCET